MELRLRRADDLLHNYFAGRLHRVEQPQRGLAPRPGTVRTPLAGPARRHLTDALSALLLLERHDAEQRRSGESATRGATVHEGGVHGDVAPATVDFLVFIRFVRVGRCVTRS